MTYLEEIGEALEGGRLEVCSVGHTSHRTRTVLTDQGELVVFDDLEYQDQPGYCAGDDAVSRGLRGSGRWEAHVFDGLEELGVWDDPAPGELVLDFGSHVGWYTLRAARAGFDVLAVDGEVEKLEVLARNLEPFRDQVVPCRAWIDGDTKQVPAPPRGTRVRLVKADVESNERHVIRAVEPLLVAGVVAFLLLEISPVFRPDYQVEVLDPVRAAGFSTAYTFRGDGLPEPWGWRLDFPQAEILFVRD